MISFQHTCDQQPDQSGFVDTPGTSTPQSTTFTSRLSIVPYRSPFQPLLMIFKRKNDLKRIHKENYRIEKWLKILPKYQTILAKNPKKSTPIPLRPLISNIFTVKKYVRKGIPDSLRGKIWSFLANTQASPPTKNLFVTKNFPLNCLE